MGTGEDLFGLQIPKGEAVFREGESGDSMFLIQDGAVELSFLEGGEKVVFAILERGDFFGEMALFDVEPRSATATSLSPCRLLPFTRQSLEERLRVDPAVSLHMLKAFCSRIEKANRGSRSPKGRASPSAGRERKDCLPPEVQSEPSAASIPSPAGGGEPREFKAGETIFRKGDPGKGMYIITGGAVNIYDEGEGERYLIVTLQSDDFFGEMSLLSDNPRTATVVAATGVKTLFIGKDDFLDRISAEPELGVYLLHVLTARLRRMRPGGGRTAPAGPEDRSRSGVPFILRKESPLKIAFVSLSSCAGCSSVILEDHEGLSRILERSSIEYCPLLMDEEEIGNVDIAVVEGVVRMREDEEKLRLVRERSRMLIAWGTCATHGGIPFMANSFTLEDLLEESFGGADDPYSYYLSGTSFRGGDLARAQGSGLLRKALKTDDVVRVDFYLSGCPPTAGRLARAIESFGSTCRESSVTPIVCSECRRKPRRESVERLALFPGGDEMPHTCFLSRGVLCLGQLTQGGCGAPCTKGGLPCWGCRGPSPKALKKLQGGATLDGLAAESLMRKTGLGRREVEELVRTARRRALTSLSYFNNFSYDPGRML